MENRSRRPLTPGVVFVGCVAVAAALGAIVGLVVGLFAYPPTAPVAMLELGIPAALLGCVVGGIGAGVVHLVRRADAQTTRYEQQPPRP